MLYGSRKVKFRDTVRGLIVGCTENRCGSSFFVVVKRRLEG